MKAKVVGNSISIFQWVEGSEILCITELWWIQESKLSMYENILG